MNIFPGLVSLHICRKFEICHTIQNVSNILVLSPKVAFVTRWVGICGKERSFGQSLIIRFVGGEEFITTESMPNYIEQSAKFNNFGCDDQNLQIE